MWKKLVGTTLLYTAATYAYDVLYRPAQVAKLARDAATKRNKELLNVGAGTARSSLRSLLFGPTLWGDTNVDIAARPQEICKIDNVCYGDIHKLPFKDKQFGAVIASHVLEHVSNPERAMEELRRVADEVFVIVPLWWCPHTWLHPGHMWYIEGNIAYPLWGNKQEKIELNIGNV